MPLVKGKHFPYTKAGKKAAASYAKKTGAKRPARTPKKKPPKKKIY